MAGLSWLRAGTITVTNGSRAVVGTDTIWSGGVVNPGDIILLPNGTLGEVESVGSNAALTLKQAYTGATASAQPYAIIRMLPSGNVAADLAASLQALIQRYGITLDQLMEWLDSGGTVSFSDGTTTLSVLHGLRKLMADVASKASAANPTFAGGLAIAPQYLTVGGLVGRLDFRGYAGYESPLAARIESFVPAGSAGTDFQDLRFSTVQGNGVHERVRITHAGEVLVGTTAANGFDRLQVTGSVSATSPIKPGQYTLATLPSASAYNGYTISVSNATGGPALCLSNGTSWINVRTNAAVS